MDSTNPEFENQETRDCIPSRTYRTPSDQLRVRHGRLSERTVCELLFFAFTTGMDGTLACSQNAIIKTLRFKAGKLLEARSNDPQDSSEYILHEMGVIREPLSVRIEPAFQLQLGQSNTYKLLAEQIKIGRMQPSEIDEFIHRRFRRILHDVMSWREGNYVLELSRIPKAEPALKVHRSIPEMILREMKTAPDPWGLRELLSAPQTVIEPLSIASDFIPLIKLTAVEQRIFKAVQKPMSLSLLSRQEGLGLEATARITLGLNAISLLKIAFQSVPSDAINSLRTQSTSTTHSDSEDPKHSNNAASSVPPETLNNPTSHEVSFESMARLILEKALTFNPYEIFDVEDTSSFSDIEQKYRLLSDRISSGSHHASKEIFDVCVSVLSVLEEAWTILSTQSLRTRFDTISRIVDVEKRINASNTELRRGLQAFKEKHLNLAIIHLKFASLLDPANSDFYYKLIYLAGQNRRLWTYARMLQEFSLNQFGTNATILALSGFLHNRTNDLVLAKKDFENALKIDPDNDLARQGLGIILKRKP